MSSDIRATPVRPESLTVEVAGIEPASFDTEAGLLRAQFVGVGLAPLIVTTRQRQAELLFDVPRISPAAG